MTEIDSNQDNRRKIQERTQFQISHADYAALSNNAARRRKIKLLLDKYNVVINIATVEESFLIDNDIEADEFHGGAIISGIGNARAYYDGTSNTGEIKQGKPIVFDTVTGKSITGINDDWYPSEYKIVGIALADYDLVGEQSDNLDVIPIELYEPRPKSDGVIVMTPPSGIAARSGLTIYGELCDVYRIDPDADFESGEVDIELIESYDTNQMMVYNTSNSAIGGDKIIDTGELVEGVPRALVVSCNDE